jgi:hypothetical protein
MRRPARDSQYLVPDHARPSPASTMSASGSPATGRAGSPSPIVGAGLPASLVSRTAPAGSTSIASSIASSDQPKVMWG